jgi:AI-2 transport protein TqsA
VSDQTGDPSAMDAPAQARAGTPAPPRAPAPDVRTAVIVIALLLALAAMWVAREIVAPLALAAVLVIIVHPIRHPLQRRGWPRWAATMVVVAVAYLILAVLAALLVFAGFEFGDLVGEFADQLQASVASVTDWLQDAGFGTQLADATSTALDPSVLLDVAQGVSGWVLGFATAAFFVLAYVIFMAAWRAWAGHDEIALPHVPGHELAGHELSPREI